ncbi:LD-carboxypeptidase [Synechococcus sp. ROS8604]|uniref:S66 peptidase family protein n=1 Tax=Synechococcus sp. ROS8604 TaxID=1442557 RepID=UPI001862F216|nr:LD-carboxypeptidase family protein [Synechococcus sp. ROS8604]
MRRRSFFTLGIPAALAMAVPFSANALAASSPKKSFLRPLKRGSRLRAVNAGTWIDPDTDFGLLVQRCEAEGWALEIPESVRRQWQWFSGTDQQRADDLERAWNNPSLDGLIYVGAGWGGARVLEVGFRFPKRPLWTLGFSDTSSMLLAQWSAGLRGAIHGSTTGPDQQWERTVHLLKGEPVAPLQGRAVRPGVASGPLVVTNLTVATHLIGTPCLPDLRGSILVLEDVGEAPYRVDRMLTQWRSSGLLRGLAGVATGRFSWKGEVEPGDFSMDGILEERLSDLGIPLVMNLPLGHGLPNMALPLGAAATLDANQGTLQLNPERTHR